MMKKVLISFLFLFVALNVFAQDNNSVFGYWKTLEDDGRLRSIVYVYEYDGKVYGRILRFCLDPEKRATNIVGEPKLSGIDFLYDMKKNDKGRYDGGKLVDAYRGKVYSGELWYEDGNLVARGKIGPFGANRTWYRAEASIIDDELRAMTKEQLIPKIPEVK